jgi:hypothetical protein
MSGGSKSTIICQDMVMMSAWPLSAVVSMTTGPGLNQLIGLGQRHRFHHQLTLFACKDAVKSQPACLHQLEILHILRSGTDCDLVEKIAGMARIVRPNFANVPRNGRAQ